MELLPQDLGKERYLSLLRRRLTPFPGMNGSQAGANALSLMDESTLAAPDSKTAKLLNRPLGRRLRQHWVKDLQLDEETSERVGLAVARGSLGMNIRVASIILSTYLILPAVMTIAFGAPAFIPILILLVYAGLMALVLGSPRQTLRKQHKRGLTATEMESLLPTARGRLERGYFSLVLDALKTDVPTETAQNDIRAALKDLGDTVARLPADAVPVADSAALHVQAEEKRLEAQAENDSFVKASLLRQAEGYERRAALSDQNVVSARRLSALRREARIQMDALRTVLVAFQHTSQSDAAAVAHLGDAVARVAQEASAVAVARRELEEDEIARLFGRPLPANLPAQPLPTPATAQKVAVGNGGAQPVENGQPQVVQTRNWWRNQ